MATETSSIDDLLSGNVAQSSSTEINEPMENNDYESSDSQPVEQDENHEYENESTSEESDSEQQQEEIEEDKLHHDEYGNEKPKPRTYTEEELNERINKAIRERLARGNHQANQQPTEQQMRQHAKDFEYDPDSGDSWQVQLEHFVKQTINKVNHEQIAQQQAIKEQEVENEFRDKFTQGMEKFSDFRDVVGSQPVTDAMTLALRGFKDPASFIYAASKRHPNELQRISQLRDPYSQIVEMGKLEERMRKAPQSTKAPRPVSRSTEDAPIKFKEKSTEPSIEELIAQSESRKLSKIKQIRGK